MPDLRYDTEDIKATAQLFENTGKDMLDLKSKLSSQIAALKDTYWVSSGGEAFQEAYEDNWGDNIVKYVDVLNEMARLLKDAAGEYERLESRARALKIDDL